MPPSGLLGDVVSPLPKKFRGLVSSVRARTWCGTRSPLKPHTRFCERLAGQFPGATYREIYVISARLARATKWLARRMFGHSPRHRKVTVTVVSTSNGCPFRRNGL
jgi:hypothetical protein